MKIKITEMHPEDAYYNQKDRIIGKVFTTEFTQPSPGRKGWNYAIVQCSPAIIIKNGTAEYEQNGFCFYAVKYKKIS